MKFYRVLKPNGWGIFMVPLDRHRENTYEDATITSPKERERHFGQADHVRQYGLDYPKRLSSVGFEVIEDDFIKSIDSQLIERYCLPKDENYIFMQKATKIRCIKQVNCF